MNIRIASFAAAVLINTTLLTAAAHADEVPSIRVNYGDLNLATEAGKAALHQRITASAREVCADPNVRNLAAMSAAKKCQKEAIERAVNDVNNAQLAAAFARR